MVSSSVDLSCGEGPRLAAGSEVQMGRGFAFANYLLELPPPKCGAYRYRYSGNLFTTLVKPRVLDCMLEHREVLECGSGIRSSKCGMQKPARVRASSLSNAP